MRENISVSIEIASDGDKNYIMEGLVEYNNKFVKDPAVKRLRIVVFDEYNNVVGGAGGTVSWGWLWIGKLWVDSNHRNRGIGRALIQALQNEGVKSGITKACVETIIDVAVDFYKKLGYELDGMLEDMPKGHRFYCLSNKHLEGSPVSIATRYTIDIDNEKREEYYKLISKKLDDEYGVWLGDNTEIEINAIARGEDKRILGGLLSYVKWDWLYIDILWLNEDIRKYGIGKRLLEAVEGRAMELGVNKFYLGTTDFQARGFYERNGYEVFIISDDMPPGYRNYSMKKIVGAD